MKYGVMIFHWKSSAFSFLKISAMMSCGLLWDRMPRCHLDRLKVRFIRELLTVLDTVGMGLIYMGEGLKEEMSLIYRGV
jgi:hypothetical protein